MDNRYAHIASRVFNTPLLIEQGKLNAILSVLAPRLGFEVAAYEGPKFEHGKPDMLLERYAEMSALNTKRMVDDGGYYLVNGNTAVVPVIGSLIQRADMFSEMSGMTSYARIERMFNGAMANSAVRDVILELDSPGGEVAGAFDMADKIYNSRGKGKRIVAVASEMAASAAYLLASAADEVVAARTGPVGSIGVVAAHYDYSERLKKQGVAVTLLYAGEKKVDGNPFQPLPDGVKAEWLAEIQDVYALFVETVARNLDIGADRVRGTQAAMYMGSKAVQAGLADRVNTFANELSNAALRSSGSGSGNARFYGSSTNDEKEPRMKDEKGGAVLTHTAEQVASAEAAARASGVEEGKTAGQAEATKTGASAERTRIAGILKHAEAEGRTALAMHLALETDSTVEAAGGLLKVAAKSDAKPTNALAAAMAAQGGGAGIPSQATAPAKNEAANTINPNAIYASRKAK